MAKSEKAVGAFLILSVAGLARAQVASATLSGTVTDPSSAVISAAAVTVTQPATGFSRTTVTDAHGSYSFDQLAPGRYTISARKPGFREYEGESLNLELNQNGRHDIRLQIGGEAGAESARRQRFLVPHVVERLRRGAAVEGWSAG